MGNLLLATLIALVLFGSTYAVTPRSELWDSEIYLHMILENQRFIFKDTANVNKTINVLTEISVTDGPYPKYSILLGAFYRRMEIYDSMNLYFDKTLLHFDDTTLKTIDRGPYRRSYYEHKIDSIRSHLWNNAIRKKYKYSVNSLMTLAIKNASHEPQLVRLRNNLARVQEIRDSLGSLPEIFLHLGMVYRQLGVLDSMHIFFDSTLLYCSDEALYYNDRECCFNHKYEYLVDSLRSNIVADPEQRSRFIKSIDFYDNFKFNVNGWPEGRYGGAAVGLGGGKYAVSIFSQENLVVPKIPVLIKGDYIIKTPVKKSDGKDTDSYGLLWGGNKSASYFVFLINGEGLFSIKKLENNLWIDVIGWREAPELLTGNAQNVLAVEKRKNTFIYYINGEVVAETVYQRKYGDYIGYITTGDVTFSSEYFLIYKPVSNDS